MPKRKVKTETGAAEPELAIPSADLVVEDASPVKRQKTRGIEKDGGDGNESTRNLARKRGKQVKRSTVPSVEGELVGNVNQPDEGQQTENKSPRRRKVKSEEQVKDIKDEEPDDIITEKKIKRKQKTKAVERAASPEIENKKVEKKVQRKRKTKEEKEAEAMPLAARTVGHKLFIGAHVSASGGVQNSVANSVHIGANAFALFLKSQRKWVNPPLLDDQCASFHEQCKTHAYEQAKHVVPHGSYLVNLAHTDKARTEQAYTAFLDDLQRCERLGIQLYNFHPGVANSTNGDRHAAIKHLASNINRAHQENSTVVTLLENMAHGGNTLGSTFEDLRDIIALIDDQKRVGVCLDTCHAFAGGYDLRTPSAFASTMEHFDDVVGVKYLRAVHMNDSKAPFASHRDLHANIGTGFLGLRAFHNLVNDVRFEGLPLVLETPLDAKDENGAQLKDEKGKDKEDKNIWACEIKLLQSLVGMDPESEEFAQHEIRLAKKGESERQKMLEQMERKKAKDEKKSPRKKSKMIKAGSEDDEDSPLSDPEH